MGLTQEGRAHRNFLPLSAPPQTERKVSLKRVAACLGAGDPPRGWAEAFKRLAILNRHAERSLSTESFHELSATSWIVRGKGEAIGARASPTWSRDTGDSSLD